MGRELERERRAVLLTPTMSDTLRRAREAAQGWARRGLTSEHKALLERALTSRPLAVPLRLLAGRIPCGECSVDTRFSFVADHTRAQMFWGTYESAERRCIASSLEPGHDVVELGASLGVVSSHLARRLAPGRTLVCVEAFPAFAESIRRNVAANAPGARVKIESAAIAYGVEHVALAHGADTTMGRVGGDADGPSVPALTLSALLERHGLGRYVLVMDIEGAEAEILASDSAALSRCVQIIAELHETRRGGRVISPEDLAREIESLGFNRAKQDGFVYVFARRSS
jgi:FkbM family methyltransferase